MFKLRAILAAVVALVSVCLVTGNAQAAVLFQDNFDAYTTGNLVGQGGWFTPNSTNVYVEPASAFSGKSMSGNKSSYATAMNRASHALGGSLANLASSQIYVLDFDAYASTTTPSDNAAFGYVVSSPGFAGVAGWWADAGNNRWQLDVRDIVGASGFGSASGGMNTPAKFRLTINGHTNTLSAYYDFGSGMTRAATFAVTDAQIATVVAIGTQQDTRVAAFGPIEVDNVVHQRTDLYSTVLFQEDFEGGTNGQSIKSAPFNWVSTRGSSDVLVTSSTSLPGLALDGSTAVGGLTSVGTPIPVPAPSADAVAYSVMADLYVSSTGTSNTGIQFGSGASDYPSYGGLFYGPGGWVLDARGLPGVSSTVSLGGAGVSEDQVVQGIIWLDLENNTITGTIKYSGGVLSATTDFTDGGEAAINHFIVFNDVRSATHGIDVDNIVIAEWRPVPEPSSIALACLGLVGLVGCTWRRKRRAG